jgi:hypothetical protein
MTAAPVHTDVRPSTKTTLNWQVRYTWESLGDVPHPKFTYAAYESEDRAIDQAVAAIDRMNRSASLRLVAVHRRDISSVVWTRVE